MFLAAAFVFAGCSKQQAATLYDSDSLRIVREGAYTRIYDLAGDAEYTYHTHRTRAAQAVKEAAPGIDTETVKIQSVHTIIIITDKTAGKTLYIRAGKP